MDTFLQAILGIALGIGLAAATGFRIFVPLLVAGVAARAGLLPLNDAFHWLSSMPALLMLGTAAVAESIAYFIPGVDHVLDVVAGPAAVGAGIVASASVMADVPPTLMWPLAVIAGGGIAGVAKGGTALVRAKTGVTTAGLANPLVAVAETVGATGLAVLAVAFPLLCLVLVAAMVYAVMKFARRLAPGRRRGAGTPDQ
jgi:hypothetical protein